MAFFRPRIGKKDNHRGEAHVGGQLFEKHLRVGLDKMEVAKPGSVALAKRAFDPFAGDINSHTYCHGMSVCVGGQKMAVAAPDFPNETRPVMIVKNGVQPSAQVLAAILDAREVCSCAGGIIHVGMVCDAQGDAVPLPDSKMIMRTLMSAGLTPLIREACPSVNGFVSASLIALSRRNPRRER